MKKILFMLSALLLFGGCAAAEECNHDWQITESEENCEVIRDTLTCSFCGETRVEETLTGEKHKITDALLYDYCDVLQYGCPICDTVLYEEKGPLEHDYFNTLSHPTDDGINRTCPRCHKVIMHSTQFLDDAELPENEVDAAGETDTTNHRDVRFCQQPDSLEAELIVKEGSPVQVLETGIVSESGVTWAKTMYRGLTGYIPQEYLTKASSELE